MRTAVAIVAVMIVSACSGNRVTSPTPTPVAAEAWAGRGAVHDTIGRPIADARVEVQDGPQRGLTVFSDAQGSFQFEAVFRSPFLVRASKAGYRDQTLSIFRTDNPAWFHLASVNPTMSFSGAYTLTFTADSACTAIPGYARRRTFEASVTNSGGTILVTLAGGGYGGTTSGGYFNNVLYAGVFEDVLRLHMSDPPVVERFPQGSHLMIAGHADGSIAQLPTTMPVTGLFMYCAQSAAGADPQCAVTEVRCQSSKHQLTIGSR